MSSELSGIGASRSSAQTRSTDQTANAGGANVGGTRPELGTYPSGDTVQPSKPAQEPPTTLGGFDAMVAALPRTDPPPTTGPPAARADVFNFDPALTANLGGPSAADRAGYPSGRSGLLASIPPDVPTKNNAAMGLQEATMTLLGELPSLRDAKPFSLQQMHDEAARLEASDNLKRAYNRVKNDPAALNVLTNAPGRPQSDTSQISRRDFTLLNEQIASQPELMFDGKIKPSKQGDTGNCAVLSAINGIAVKPGGAERLGSLIKPVLNNDAESFKDHHFEVTFPGDPKKKPYSVTKDEVDKARAEKQVGQGDLSTNILEIAYEKYAHDQGSTGASGGRAFEIGALLTGGQGQSHFINPNDRARSADELTRAVNNGDMVTMNVDANTFEGTAAQQRLNGDSPNQLRIKENTNRLNALMRQNPVDLEAITRVVEENTRLAQDESSQNQGMANHALAVKSIQNGIVTYTNPWNSSDDLHLPLNEFMRMGTLWHSASIP